MVLKNKKVRLGHVSCARLDKYLVKRTTPTRSPLVENNADPDGMVWAPCPRWIEDLASAIVLENPCHNKCQILELVVPHIINMEVERDIDFIEICGGKARATRNLRRNDFTGILTLHSLFCRSWFWGGPRGSLRGDDGPEGAKLGLGMLRPTSTTR